MTRWWEKTLNKVGDKLEGVAESVLDAGSDFVESGTDLLKNGKCYKTISKLQDSGKECYQLAKETTELCETTQTRGQEMIDFGSEIKDTLHGFSSKMDAETLETIKDLMDGDRLKSAMALAEDMDDIALSCVEKSVRMIEIMEDTMDSVPDVLEGFMNKAAGPDDAEAQLAQERSLGVLSTLDQDVEDVKSCIDALEHLNITTALKVGMHAFENLSAKAALSRTMFITISGFAEEVSGYTRAISEGDIGDMFKLANKVKDMWHCLKLSAFMRQLAEGAGKLIRIIIDLFKSMSNRLSTLWAALAFAKNCMVDCMEYVVSAKKLVVDAHEKSALLIERSRSIKDQLQSLGSIDFRGKSIHTARQLSEGGEIQEAIQLASTMDDLVVDCSKQVIAMIVRVTEGFQNLPEIITADVNVQEDGKQDDDQEPDDIEENITQLELKREVIEKSNVISAARTSVAGFHSVLDNASHCRNMLELVEGFTGNCSITIEAFLGTWDLESAMEKIREMCRIVRLGELIKQFAEHIKKLLKAIVALMKATMEKLSIKNLSNIDLGDAVGDIAHDAIDSMKDSFGDMKDKMTFWKKK